MKPFAVFPGSRPGLPDLSPARRRLVIAGLAAAAILFLCGLGLTVYLWRISRKFPQAPYAQPSRLYASVPALVPGEPFSAAEMVAELADAGYHEETGGETGGAGGTELPTGAYRRAGDLVAVHLRKFPTPDGEAGGDRLEVAFRGARVAAIRSDGKAAKSARLEPPLLASFYDKNVEERRPVTLAALPDLVVKAVLAAEDSGFYTHPGVSPTGNRPRPVGQRTGRRHAGGEHDQPAAGQERLPVEPPHARAQGRGGADRRDARAASRQASDPRGLSERDLPRPQRHRQSDRPRRRRPRLLRQGRRRAVAPRGGDRRRDDRVAGRPVPH